MDDEFRGSVTLNFPEASERLNRNNVRQKKHEILKFSVQSVLYGVYSVRSPGITAGASIHANTV